MNLAHHRPYQAFDVSAKMRLPAASMLQRNSVFLTTTQQRLRMKFLSVIDVNKAG